MAEGEGNQIYMPNDLYEAARERTVDAANTVILTDVFSMLRPTPGDRSNVLHVAAWHGNHMFISALFARRPTPFLQLLCKRNSQGQTPLHLAAQSGCRETVEVLLKAHHDAVNQNNDLLDCWGERDNQGNTPVHIALRHRHEAIASLLFQRDIKLASLDNNEKESLAYLAAQYFCPNFLKAVLCYDRMEVCSVSISGPFGQTAFHPARKLTGEIMSILIQRRKHLLNTQDEKGKTVLDYAVEENIDPIVRILLNADTTLAYLHDRDGLTPLHKAASRGLLQMVRTILELSPQSMAIRDKSRGQTALHVVKMSPCCLEECLTNTRMRELINEVDNDGNTPLHLAFMNSDKTTANKLLLVSDINWYLTNKQGNTPMDLCTAEDKISLKLVSVTDALRTLVIGDKSLRRYKWCNRTIKVDDKSAKKLLDSIAVVAALLATVTFAVPFTIPGGYDPHTGQAVRIKEPRVKLFLMVDIMAMLMAMSALIVYTFGRLFSVNLRWLVLFGIFMLEGSLVFSIAGFLVGVSLVGPHSTHIITAAGIGAAAVAFAASIILSLDNRCSHHSHGFLGIRRFSPFPI